MNTVASLLTGNHDFFTLFFLAIQLNHIVHIWQQFLLNQIQNYSKYDFEITTRIEKIFASNSVRFNRIRLHFNQSLINQ